jgi:glycerophosphoryl diester phosphodiesterase
VRDPDRGLRPLRLAHRGDWRIAPENTVAAIRAALAVPGCDGVEFDVRFSRDGAAVLLHDETLLRVHGVPDEVAMVPAAELAAHGVPTLAEVLAAAGPEPYLDIELKAPPGPSLLEALTARATPGGGLDRVAISSFEAGFIGWVAEQRPAWTRWLIARDMAPGTLAATRDLGCAAIAVQWRSIDQEAVDRAREQGLDVVAWTVRRRPTFERLARLGVFAICVEAAALDG